MLKKISFHGFKSFADKVEVDFSEGITAVIGPNGCGKSNIFDGVRWVLGEQSAKSLRGGKMDDVIFSGSDSRKPQNMAEVSLFLDNKTGVFKLEDEEVIITRRATRGKGSEYFINNEPAKMKQVHELFMDTGVGSNSYSIIGQGQIEKILSTKIEDRRAIFEEASGIVKLKQQKEQTEKNLNEVDNNLIRIEDILKEIEKQLTPLRNQSEKAKEFKLLDEELRTIETQYLLHELDSIDVNLKENQSIVSELEESINANNKLLEEKEEELINLKYEFQTNNEDTFEFQKQVSNKKEEISKLKSSIELCNEKKSNSLKQIKFFNEQLKEIEDKFSLSTGDFNEKQNNLEVLEKDLSVNEIKIQDSNLKISDNESKKMNLDVEVEFTRNSLTNDFNELSKEKLELDQLKEKEIESNTFLNNVSEKINIASLEKEEAEIKFNEINIKFNDINKELKDKDNYLSENRKEYNSKKEKLSDLISKLNYTENEIIKTKNKIEILENSFENNDSFFEGVKSVLNYAKDNKIKGINGAVADLIKVDKNYEIAVETIMASTMQFIVTEDDTVAKEAVNYLKSKKLGKATFLPLNMANGSKFDSKELKIISESEGISLTSDFVHFDIKYSDVVTNIIGRTIIADNLDIAVEFIKKHKLKAKISTMEGEIVQLNSISGGQNKNSKSSYFKKKSDLEEFNSNLISMNEDLITYKSEKEIIESEIKILNDNILSSEEEINVLNKKLLEEKIIFEEFKSNFENKSNKLNEIEIQEKEVSMSISSLRKNILNLEISIENSEENYKNNSKKLENLTLELNSVILSIDNLKNDKMELIVKNNKLKDDIENIKIFLEDYSNGSDNIEEKIKSLYSLINKEEEIITSTDKDIELFDNEMVKLVEIYENDFSSLNEMLSDNKELTDKTDEIESFIKEIRSKKENDEKIYNSKKIYISKKETEKNNIISKFEEIYELNEEGIKNLERLEINKSDSKKEIDKLKRKINSLGSINHQAIEDCELLEERFSSEKTQFDDVNSAKKDLIDLLNKVEEEMKTKFVDTFTNVSEFFKNIFVDLFGGGKATLSLLDEKNPLTSPIEIIAQPPGKKPQSINLLSGGEKAFTAVALIFSIISAKPSPFVIFDEVDAPLDDANVVRYAKYTKEYSKKCQFILVTHRKQCMQMASSLLGITQKVPGVSIMFPYSVDDLDSVKEAK